MPHLALFEFSTETYDLHSPKLHAIHFHRVQ